jgi:hypothetical protein
MTKYAVEARFKIGIEKGNSVANPGQHGWLMRKKSAGCD